MARRGCDAELARKAPSRCRPFALGTAADYRLPSSDRHSVKRAAPEIVWSDRRFERVMSDLANHFRERWSRTVTVLRAPRVRIEMYGGEEARALHRLYTARHPRFLITQHKRWGVALISLPESFDQYLRGRSKTALRQNRRRALDSGFRYALVSPQDHLDEILEINRSAPTRQGRAMEASYVDREKMIKTFEGRTTMHAILDSRGRLRAYALVAMLGDAFVFWKILGHAEDLGYGTMYLLVSEVIREYVDLRRANGSPRWAMYDTFWGASRGLAYFKERVGFRPYTVEWVWVDRA
jgi:hypothetical protein